LKEKKKRERFTWVSIENGGLDFVALSIEEK
jgi:hypothetical protein